MRDDQIKLIRTKVHKAKSGCPCDCEDSSSDIVRLADILWAMNEKLSDDRYPVGHHGCTHKPEGQWLLHNWILSKDNLTEQSPECIAFLADLLK